MLVLLIAAALSAPTQMADVWLDCTWQETSKSTASLGSATTDKTSVQDFAKSYMFSPKDNSFYLYQSDQTLFPLNAVIGTNAILVEDKDHYERLGYQSKRDRQWSVSRQDLKVVVIGTYETDTQMDDGRIGTSTIVETGEGACAMTGPKPLATPAPNKF